MSVPFDPALKQLPNRRQILEFDADNDIKDRLLKDVGVIKMLLLGVLICASVMVCTCLVISYRNGLPQNPQHAFLMGTIISSLGWIQSIMLYSILSIKRDVFRIINNLDLTSKITTQSS